MVRNNYYCTTLWRCHACMYLDASLLWSKVLNFESKNGGQSLACDVHMDTCLVVVIATHGESRTHKTCAIAKTLTLE